MNGYGSSSKHKRRGPGKNKKIEQRRMEKKLLRTYRLAGQVCFWLLMLSGIGFLVALRPHQVDGQSMMPTLADRDRLLVFKSKSPNRYDLIVFDPQTKDASSYVKRVIGLPGDRIWLDNNTLYLNSQLAETDQTIKSNQFLTGEDLPDSTLKLWVNEEVARALYGLDEIPANHYFVLGDNRNHSTDSRKLGLIEDKQIEGIVVYRYFPLNRLGSV